ncbi:uncharacterized protein LOC105278146 [Ooceraea biroi]|uniref:uncharacterized protein LOC105278146 n=1 Tax=Ooceraea biroi TaxID=2015173 RepID=UPI0009716270|nr:uncharacterized protein LOC105278146 [Ooceraea biroi]
MEVTHNHYYDIVYKISSLTGMWPYLKPRTRIFRVTLLTLVSLTIIIPEIAYQCMCKNMQCTFQAMTAYLLSAVSLLKMYTFQINIRTIRSLTEHLFTDWKELRTPEEYEIMKSYAENSRRFSLIYLVYCFLAVVIFMSMSLVPYILNIVRPLNQSRPILPPYRGYYFIDSQEHFFQILWHSIVGWEVVVAAVVAHDSLFVTYVEHICSMFALIGFHFEHLFHNNNGTVKILNADSRDVDHKKIAFFVHRHREILECAQHLEDIFTFPFAIQILIVTVGMSITLLQITQQNDDYLEATRYVFYVIAEMIHLFFLSLEGQKLIDHSFQIRDRIYHSSWYNVSTKSQKMAMIVMARSRRPAFFSAGKVYIFSLESFTTTMSSTYSQYYDVIKKVSSLAGQWPYQTPRTRLFCVSLITLNTLSVIVLQMVNFVKCDGNLHCIFETMTSYTLTFVTLVKLFTCYFNRCKIKALIDHFFNDWDKLETPEEYEIMETYAKNGRRYSMGYSLYCFACLALFMCASLIPQLLNVVLPLNESRPVLPPYPGHYFVDEEEYFLHIFCHSIVAWEIAMTGIVAHDCMFLSCVEHGCSIFAVAGFRFERLIYEDTPMKVLRTHWSDSYCKRIVFSVHTHQEAVKFAQFLEDIFSLSLAIQVGLNTVVISITLLQITHQNSDTLESSRYIVYIAGQLIHLFYLSFEGQKLIDHSLQMCNKIYNGSWYELPIKSQKLMLLVMMKSFRPCCVSAGKIYIFSLQGFCTVKLYRRQCRTLRCSHLFSNSLFLTVSNYVATLIFYIYNTINHTLSILIL